MKALNIDPELSAIYNNFGTLSFSQGNYKDAEEWFNKVLKIDSENSTAAFNLGLAYKMQQKVSPAKEQFKRAWDNSANLSAGNELGLIELNTGNPIESIKYFRDIIKKSPSYLSAYYNLGLALKNIGEKDESIKFFQFYMDNIKDEREMKETKKIIENMLK